MSSERVLHEFQARVQKTKSLQDHRKYQCEQLKKQAIQLEKQLMEAKQKKNYTMQQSQQIKKQIVTQQQKYESEVSGFSCYPHSKSASRRTSTKSTSSSSKRHSSKSRTTCCSTTLPKIRGSSMISSRRETNSNLTPSSSARNWNVSPRKRKTTSKSWNSRTRKSSSTTRR